MQTEKLARLVGGETEGVRRALALLEAGRSPALIGRLRRDETGGLDESQVAKLRDQVRAARRLDDRRASLLRSLQGQGKLNDTLREQIQRADTLLRLEDLQLQHKPRPASPAAEAEARGLAPLADDIVGAASAAADLDARAADFVDEDKKVTSVADALAGAGRILADRFAHDPELRRRARPVVRKTGKLVSRRADGASDKKANTYQAYLDYREPLGKAPPHRVLAVNRGERAKALAVSVEADTDAVVAIAKELFAEPTHPHTEFLAGCAEEAVRTLLMPSLAGEARASLTERAEAHSMEVFARNLRNLLLGPRLPGRRVLAIDPGYQNGCQWAAIDESGGVLATGCVSIVTGGRAPPSKAKKAAKQEAAADARASVAPEKKSPETDSSPASDSPAVAEASSGPAEANTSPAPEPTPSESKGGDPAADTSPADTSPADTSPADTSPADTSPADTSPAEAETPTNEPAASEPAPVADPIAAAREQLTEAVRVHGVTLIAIGNGKACRPAEELVATLLAEELEGHQPGGKSLEYLIVSEAGANVYASSTVGREELPGLAAPARGAVSIGRRAQDPLAELVKVDPASVGVGLYQHDAKSKPMRDALEEVVQSCVAHVGVDLNTAAASLLRYVPGMNALTARRLCDHRAEHGPFASRAALLESKILGEEAFAHAAGFVRVAGAEHPFDAAWLHPDHYPAAEKLLAALSLEPASLGSPGGAAAFGEAAASRDRAELAAAAGVGPHTLALIVASLSDPGADPRDQLPPPSFRRGVVRFDDLKPGDEVQGSVLNVVDFGAFVDIGLSDSGLLHISRMSSGFVSDPHAVVSVGDQVRVWIDSVDAAKRRVSLSMVDPNAPAAAPRPRGEGGGSRRRRGKADKASGAAAEPAPSRSSKPTSDKPRRDRSKKHRRGDKPRPAQPKRPTTYETRSKEPPPPISREMQEGKEAMRTFGDLLQFVKNKDEGDGQES